MPCPEQRAWGGVLKRWMLLSYRTPGPDFDICLAGALAVVADLAYCAVGEMERKDVTRVPGGCPGCTTT